MAEDDDDSEEQQEDSDEQAPMHCIVLSAVEKPGDLSGAAAVVEEVFGPGYSVATEDNNIIGVLHGEEPVGFLAHVPTPVPGGEAEDNADRNLLWPKGKEEAAAHRSHVIVTTLGTGDSSPIQAAIVVSRLALVALKLFDGIGVYWGNASVCNKRSIFEDYCETMSEEQVPIPMWLRFQLVRASEDGDEVGLYTLGMDQFGLMDFEVDRCRMDLVELFDFVADLAHYVVQKGPVIDDGDTVGGSEAQRIVVRHEPSMIEEDRQVYKIHFET